MDAGQRIARSGVELNAVHESASLKVDLTAACLQTLMHDSFIIGPDDRILVTGAAGFIGSRVVESLLDRGFRNLVCFARPSSDLARLETVVKRHPRSVANRHTQRQSPFARGL